MYRVGISADSGRGFGRYGGDWREGRSSWTTDYPRSDRHFAAAMRRLTRINTRSVEQPVNLDSGEQYDWPFLYGVEVGHWNLTDEQVKSMREYLLRGGFFMVRRLSRHPGVGSVHGSMRGSSPTAPWSIWMTRTRSSIRSTISTKSYQVPGPQYLRSGRTWEQDGDKAVWRGIYDDKGRLMVAIVHNSDLGDSWEHADNPYIRRSFPRWEFGSV